MFCQSTPVKNQSRFGGKIFLLLFLSLEDQFIFLLNQEYRERVCSALAKYHGSEVRAERKPRRRPSDGTQPTKKKPAKKRDIDTSAHVKNDSKTRKPILLKKSKSPAYKDPLVNSKLEMIKNIRAQRASAETTQTHAIERAR